MPEPNERNPYQPPRHDAVPAAVAQMSRFERGILFGALLYMAVYVPYAMLQLWRISGTATAPPPHLLPAHFLGMALNLAALIVTIRDLYLRPFAEANAKLTWAILILTTGGIGWLIYVFKHALKPRRAA